MSVLSSNGGLLRIGDRDFEVLTDYLRQHFGIDLSKKRKLVEGRLNNYILHKGYGDYHSYLDHLFSDRTGAEISNVINYLTTNYSFFMREFEPMRFFTNTILPALKSDVGDRDLRIWSAGCSTGEEPYTLAMLMDDFFGKDSKLWDKTIMATDISQKALNKARQGIYETAAIKQIPAAWKNRYFERLPDNRWKVKQRIHSEVLFRRFNLIDSTFPFTKKFHVIFCRNVMIYFQRPDQRGVDRPILPVYTEGRLSDHRSIGISGQNQDVLSVHQTFHIL